MNTGIGIIIIILSIITIRTKKIEVSIYCLIGIFISAGILYIKIGLSYIGLIYVIVYTAALSILFLFVLIMLNIQSSTTLTHSTSGFRLVLGFLLFLILILIGKEGLIMIAEIIGIRDIGNVIEYTQEWRINNLDTIQGIGYILYTENITLLILIALLLLCIIIALINLLSSL